jgi:hypothetical protein
MPKQPKLPYPLHSGTAAAPQDMQQRVNAAARGQAIVGTVTHARHGGYPENQDQPYGTEHEGAGESSADTPMRGEATGKLALLETQSEGADTLSAARRSSGQPTWCAMPQGDILSFAPPLCPTREDADTIMAATKEAVEAGTATL